MKSGFDINRILGSGYLVVPLSMSRLANGHGQDPKWCLEVLHYMGEKTPKHNVSDAVFLYTNGLYFNSEEVGYEKRKKSNQQMIDHVSELRNLVQKEGRFIPDAIHFLPFDYIILNAPRFPVYLKKMKKLEESDTAFREVLKQDMMGKEYSEANVNFILEETVVGHIIRQQLVDLPKTLVKDDAWRLMVYPGFHIGADAYQIKHKILPQNNTRNPYAYGQYDFDNKVYNDYRTM